MAIGNRSFVIAVFNDNNQAQQAIQDLLNAGFNRDQIRYSVQQGSGGIADDLVNMGIPQQEANFYNHAFEQGHTVVTVHTNDQQQAFNLLKKDGGYDFNTKQGQETNYPPLSGTPATNVTAANAPAVPTGEQTRTIELRAEQLQPTTRWEHVGEVDIGKKVVSEQKTIEVPVTHEEVIIERHPASGQVSNSPITAKADEHETIRIPVSAEQVHVQKETVETGEITVGKRKVQENELVTDTVKREELQINRQGNVDVEDGNPPPQPGQ